MTYTTGTLSLAFYDRQGVALTGGTVVIVPNAPLVKDTTGHSVLSGSVSVVIAKGATYPVTVALPATDDATLDPAGVTYTVIPPKKWADPVSGVAIYTGQTRYFADLMSVTPASPTYLPGDVTRAEYTALVAADSGKIPLTQKGAASGVAPLDSGSRVAEANLPAGLAQATLSATYASRLRRRDTPGAAALPKLSTGTLPTVTFTNVAYSSFTGGTAFYTLSNSPTKFRTLGGDIQYGAVVGSTASPAGIIPKNANSFQPWALEFVSDAPILQVGVSNFGGFYRIFVDGEVVCDTTSFATTSGSTRYIQVDWATVRKIRSYRFEFDNVYWASLLQGAVDTLYPTPNKGPRAIVVGDSYVEGTGATARFTAWPWQLGRLMGWGDTWSDGSGGTGYLMTPGSGKVKYRDRFTNNVGQYQPDIIIFSGGRNDSGSTQAQIQAEATLLYQQARTECPLAAVFVLANSVVANLSASDTNIAAALQAASAAVPGVIFLNTQVPAIIWGTGKTTAVANNGNADFATGSDGQHPNQFGHDLFARAHASLIQGALARI